MDINIEINGYSAAKYSKYLLQFKNKKIVNILEPQKITAKSFYKKYKKNFDKLVFIFKKYNLSIFQYLEFYFKKLNKFEKDIKIDLISIKNICEYKNYLLNIEQYKKILKFFKKSVNNIVEDCIKLGFLSLKDYLIYLVHENKLSQYYISGKISKYFFVSIPKFKFLILKLNSYLKNDFLDIYKKFEKYNADITTAYLFFKNQKINPFKIVDEQIFETRQKKFK